MIVLSRLSSLSFGQWLNHGALLPGPKAPKQLNQSVARLGSRQLDGMHAYYYIVSANFLGFMLTRAIYSGYTLRVLLLPSFPDPAVNLPSLRSV